VTGKIGERLIYPNLSNYNSETTAPNTATPNTPLGITRFRVVRGVLFLRRWELEKWGQIGSHGKVDDKVIFYYTNSNYQAILKNLTIKDFELMKKTSSIVKLFNNLDEFLFQNYSERIGDYRKALNLI